MPQLAQATVQDAQKPDDGLFKYRDEVLWSLSNPARYLPTEAFDHLLRSIRLSAAMPGCANLTAPFGVDVSYGPDTFVIYEAYSGQCAVTFDAPAKTVIFRQGDILVLPCHTRHRIAAPENTPCIDIRDLMARQVEPHVKDSQGHPSLGLLLDQQVNYGGGGELFELRMVIMFVEKQAAGGLISGLPGPMLLSGFADKHRSLLDAIHDELNVQRARESITQPAAIRLTEALLTIALKEATTQQDAGLIYKGLADPAVSRVINAVLKEPNKDWDLQDMVDIAHVCRSALNSRFTASVGMSPRHFVNHVRLTRASEMLTDTTMSIAMIAERTNYSSEAAFNRAFRKWCGMTPGAMRDAAISQSGRQFKH